MERRGLRIVERTGPILLPTYFPSSPENVEQLPQLKKFGAGGKSPSSFIEYLLYK